MAKKNKTVQPGDEVDVATIEPVSPPTQEQYDALLNAYITLKRRVGLDAVYEKQLDSQAGIV